MNKAQVISFHCILKDKIGNVLSSTFNHDVVTQSDSTDLLKGLADGLKGLKKGDKRKVSLSADQAYGFYDPDLLVEVARQTLSGGTELKVGSPVRMQTRTGQTRLFRVTEIVGELVTLDANHPLAGQDLVFFIETTAARDATSEEMTESSTPQPRFLH